MSQSIVVNLTALCFLIGLLFLNRVIDERVIASHEKLRLDLVARQWNQMRVQRLSEASETSFVNVVGEDITILQVRIAEFLTSSESHSDHVLRYEQRVLSEQVGHNGFLVVPLDSDFKIEIVRLSLALTVPHGPYLLDWLQRVGNSAGGWPSEIRSCDVRKAIPAGLLADCILDIYHWQFNSDA